MSEPNTDNTDQLWAEIERRSLTNLTIHACLYEGRRRGHTREQVASMLILALADQSDSTAQAFRAHLDLCPFVDNSLVKL